MLHKEASQLFNPKMLKSSEAECQFIQQVGAGLIIGLLIFMLYQLFEEHLPLILV